MLKNNDEFQSVIAQRDNLYNFSVVNRMKKLALVQVEGHIAIDAMLKDNIVSISINNCEFVKNMQILDILISIVDFIDF
jgi:hypothetical protein